MPQLQTLVLKDRAAAPVDHTFAPRDIVGGVGAVVESTGVPVGDKRFTISLTRANGSGNYKGKLSLAVPVTAVKTVNGVSEPVVVRTAYADVTFTFANTSTVQERKDIIGMLQSAFDADKLLVNDTLVLLQGVY